MQAKQADLALLRPERQDTIQIYTIRTDAYDDKIIDESVQNHSIHTDTILSAPVDNDNTPKLVKNLESQIEDT